MKVLIQSNKFQELAAKVSKYSFIKNGFKDVEIINIEDCDILKRNFGRKYLRNGKITREEGVNLVKKFDHEFPKKYFKDFLEYHFT